MIVRILSDLGRSLFNILAIVAALVTLACGGVFVMVRRKR